MRMILTRALFALGTLSCLLSPAAAEDLRFSGLDRGMRAPSPSRLAVPGVRQMAYMSDVEGGEELLPGGAAPMDESMYEPMHDGGHAGCSCGSCGCGDCCCDQGACCCGQGACGYPECGGCPPSRGMFYGEAQLMLLRAHVSEEAFGKLSESHEFSPRFIGGYETCTGIGARARYWTYSDSVSILNNQGTDLDLDWNVIDVEGTARFRTDRADLVIAAGFRWTDANIEINQFSASSDMPGITLAADARAWICQSCSSQWSGICGARWSILGGDWEGELPIGDGATSEFESHDDNIVVQEIYAGFEYLRYFSHYNVFARLVFEAQNWRSDFLGTAIDTGSIGFLGPGVHVGATY